MKLYLIRHGKDDDTVRGGWSKSGLTEVGKLQAQELAAQINTQKNELKIGRLFSSDLPRAIQTATPISAVLSLEIELKPQFRETNNGIFAGMKNDIANEKYPGIYWSTLQWDEPYPQGESPRMFYERIKTAWTELSVNENAILVTHGGVINVIYSLIDGVEFSNKTHANKIPHAVMIPLIYENGIWRKE